MVAFSHLEPGTSEAIWEADGRIASLPELNAAAARLIVVAAHPDDETLGAAGLMGRVTALGGTVTVVIATDGEASHPDSTTHTPARLSELRRAEVRRAVDAIAPTADVQFLALPDSALREHRAALRSGLTEVLDRSHPDRSDVVGPALVVAPWSGDGHRDHRIAAEVVAELCAERGIRHLGYPIWLWHWGNPDGMPWERSAALSLTAAERVVKCRAIAEHRTQVEPLSSAPEDERIVHGAMRAHFERSREIFIEEPAESPPSMPARFFEDFYERHQDPWGFESRWYEKRKRRVLLASLPQSHLGRVLEIGCATGLVTAELALRADTVIAIDAATAAVDAARRRVDAPNVRFVVGRVPDEWPLGAFDVVVLSEVGYYFSRVDLERVMERIGGCAARTLVACHWRHAVAEYPQTGDAVHRALRRMSGWETTVMHHERDFLLEVFERTPTRSVAEREGLV